MAKEKKEVVIPLRERPEYKAENEKLERLKARLAKAQREISYESRMRGSNIEAELLKNPDFVLPPVSDLTRLRGEIGALTKAIENQAAVFDRLKGELSRQVCRENEAAHKENVRGVIEALKGLAAANGRQGELLLGLERAGYSAAGLESFCYPHVGNPDENGRGHAPQSDSNWFIAEATKYLQKS
jgi:hypothetical protein